MGKQKRLRVFAGPNGSGKSSLFYDLSKAAKFNVGYFLNADLIEKELREKGFINLSELNITPSLKDFQEFNKTSTLIKKAKKEGFKIDIQLKNNFLVNIPKDTNSYESSFASAFIRNELLKSGSSFSFETVMSHPSKLEEIEEANRLGYKTYLYYVCTESPIVNQKRIDTRVDKGGHAVSPDKVESRYFESLNLLYKAIKLVRRAYLFDNSGKENRLIAEFYKGEGYKLEVKRIPKWFHLNVIQKLDF